MSITLKLICIVAPLALVALALAIHALAKCAENDPH